MDLVQNGFYTRPVVHQGHDLALARPPLQGSFGHRSALRPLCLGFVSIRQTGSHVRKKSEGARHETIGRDCSEAFHAAYRIACRTSSSSNSGYASSTSSMLAPPAIILRTTPTVIRIPRMVGCPRHTAGSISIRSRGGTSIGLREIDVRTSSLSSVVPVLASTDSRRLKKSPPATPLALPAPDCPPPPSAAGHPA